MMKENLIKLYERSFIDNWELPALTDYNTDETLTYGEFAQRIAMLQMLFDKSSVKSGDRIALIGKNIPNWVITFIGTICYGAVIVPILQEFNPADVQHIINHSEATLLFCGRSMWENLEFDKMPRVRAVFELETMSLVAEKEGERVGIAKAGLQQAFDEKYHNGFYRNDIHYPDVPNDSVVEINYTSGTTGFSKGVMITANNLAGNIVYGINTRLLYKGTRDLAFLPLAHAFGCAFNLLTPLAVGSHITLLGRIPAPQILIKAMAQVKPNVIFTVPLVLEKIYNKMIVPLISRGALRWALMVPFLDRRIYGQIRNKLIDAFGGEFEEIIIGGAPFNSEVEDFLYKIRFPFTVGYGMTETAPLVSHTPWREFVPHSAGRILPGIMECKILSDDPENIPGEICIRGENVMKGYFHNTEATDKVLHEDGWLHTGDMGTLNADGTLFIKGRLKTMLLSSSGQNIYPEEIEAKLNNMLYVNESLVVMREGKLVALVYPDYDAMDQLGVTRDKLPDIMEDIRVELNKLVAPYERISSIQLIATEFQKTPKRSIKRYLYSN